MGKEVTSSSRKPEIISGRLEAHDAERGQGIDWCFNENGEKSRAARFLLQKGDILIVFNDAARTKALWGGVVDLDYETHRQQYGMYGLSEQILEPLGPVNGLQKNIDPHFWAMMFETEKPALFIRPASLGKK